MYPPSTVSLADQESRIIFAFICSLSSCGYSLYYLMLFSVLFWWIWFSVAVAFGPDTSLFRQWIRIVAVFSFLSFNSLQILNLSVYLLMNFLQIPYPGLLKRQSPTTMLRWRYKSIPFFPTQSLLQCPSIFFRRGDSHVLIRHLYATALLRGLPIQGTSFLCILASWIQLS